MMTSSNDVRETEKYLFNQLTPEDSLVFQARLFTDPTLRVNVFFQKQVYTLVKAYHRKKLKEDLDVIHQRLFSDPEKTNYRQRIVNLFKR